MKIEQYRKEVTRTLVVLPTLEENLLHMAYGITTEIGELHDIYKKELAYGKQIDLVNLKEEIGDILWYVWNGLNFLEISEENFIKIEKQKEKALDWTINQNLLKNTEILSYLIQESSMYQLIKINNKKELEYKFVIIYFNLFNLCNLYSFNIEEIMEININKLKVRFPEKFTQEAALNRNLEKERKELEK